MCAIFWARRFFCRAKSTAVSEQQVYVEVQGVGASGLILERGNVIASTKGFPTIGQAAMVAIRPEKIALSDRMSNGQSNVVEGTLEASQFLGDRYEYTVTLGAESRVIVSPEAQAAETGR